MMKIKRAVLMAVLAVAVAALAVPLVGLNARAAGSAADARAALTATKANAAAVTTTAAATQPAVIPVGSSSQEGPAGKISAETLKAIGFQKSKDPEAAAKLAKSLAKKKAGGGDFTTQSGQPTVLNARSALSAALITTIGGRDNQFSEVALIADWDGREDCTADREQKVDDFSFVEADIDTSLTRTGISEHTVANGFAENVYYYGDSLGNFWVGTDTNPGINVSPNGGVDSLRQVNIPALVNTGTSGGFTIVQAGLGCTDDQVGVTGIAVQPVADLSDFGLCGTIGEVVYVSILDTEGCSSNAANQPIRTRIFAFAFTDGVGAGAMTPAGVLQIFSAQVGNMAGVAVDDDGSLYFHLVDLIQFTGGAIFKAAPIPHVPGVDCALRSTRVVVGIPTVGLTSVTPLSSASARITNYSSGSPGAAGTITPLFGNVVSITAGPCNVLYAAVARSLVDTDDGFTRETEGRFRAPAAFASGTPSMIISFADCSGAFDVCSGETEGSVSTNVGGTLPVADGFADGPTASATRTVGVNDFRIFVQGNGPNIAPAVGGTAIVPGTPAGLLKVDLQIDFSAHAGIVVTDEGSVFVISGGQPAGVGTSPSNLIGEILCFEDMCPMDRRADFVDLRGDVLPNPPASGGNVGDGDSDRFDHLFYVAPQDTVHFTPGGLAGLAKGHLRYAWRLAPSPLGPGVTLGVTKTRQGDDDTDGPIIFENLDPGHQVAGGDDQNTPFRGDDDDDPDPAPTVSSPNLNGALSGGFEFVFGGPVGGPNCVWNAFFLNSNGNITFGEGDTSNNANVPDFRSTLPRIAPAWTDLNPTSCDIDLRTFPVQALGFANINAFKVRWINVPEFGSEVCTGDGGGFSNTFSVTLYDDGTGIDENSDKALNPANPIGNNAVPFDLQEGPTDLRWTREPNTNVLVPCPPRPAGSGIFLFEFCRMDLLGAPDNNHSVITGYSIGGLDELNPPGLCETNLSEAARDAETIFGVLPGGQTASIGCNCLIGEGTEPTIFELFSDGLRANVGSGGEVTLATPDFDLRFEGNDPALCQSVRQTDPNRGKVGFLGIGCAPPANAICQTVVPATFATTPGSTGLVNALCAVQLNLVGCGFFPNEVTTICQGFVGETGIPIKRDGKTVTTAATLSCDTNGDGIAETTVALASVQPVSCNLVRATIPVSASFGATSTSGFPSACCGGAGTITITTTFSDGDNNIFGPFTRTVTCSIALGTRAPIVISVQSNGNCAIPQDLLITGACFVINGVPSVTSVFAIDRANAANRINATAFFLVNPNLLDAFFNFGSANAGKTFLIFVQGPGGISRNITSAVAGAPANCPLGNEQGIQVTFTCNASNTTTPPGGAAPGVATITSCAFGRDADGTKFLNIIGTGIKKGAAVLVGGNTPKKIQFKDASVEPGSADTFTRVKVLKKVCKLGLPGTITVTNPGVASSAPFTCSAVCP